MFNKIAKEIEEFTSTIKEAKGCDEMLTYMDSNIYSAIKLLMFASKTFSIFARVLMFFIIFLTGVLALNAIGAMGFNMTYLAITILILFLLTIIYVMHWKKNLILKIRERKEL